MDSSFVPAKKSWRNFRRLLATDLEENAIGQCPWLSTKCIRGINRLFGGSTNHCEIFLTTRVKLKLNLSELVRICCARFMEKSRTRGCHWHSLGEARSSKAFNERPHSIQIAGKSHKANPQVSFKPKQKSRLILPCFGFRASGRLPAGAPSPSWGQKVLLPQI